MTYFVTGATGFIGGRLTRKLVNEGHGVNAVVRNPDNAKALSDLGVEIVKGDITDKESMRAAMTGVDGVFHLAAWYKVGQTDSSMAERINVRGTRNVLELARELDIPRIVYTSTLAVNSDTGGKQVDESYTFDPATDAANGGFISEYDRTKWQAHYEVAEPLVKAGLPLITVMPGLVYGPGDTSTVRDSFVQYLQGKLPMLPKGTAYSWAHVDDIVQGHLLAMEKGTPGETYIIAGPTHSLIEGFELAEEITGVKAPKMRPNPGFVKAAASLTGVVGKLVALPEQYHPEALRVIAGVTYIGDNSKAKRDLGYAPRPLKEGLTETLNHEMRLLGMKAK